MTLSLFRLVLVGLLVAGLSVFSPLDADAKRKKDRVLRDFRHADIDRDDRLSREEWNRRGNFDKLDRDGSGSLDIDEVRAIYRGHGDKNYSWPPAGYTRPAEDIDPSVAQDQVAIDALPNKGGCSDGNCGGAALQRTRGLFATGTGPAFPDGLDCPGVDDYWAMDYSHKRNRASYHGGIDIPVPWGTPMRAIADGSVVAIFDEDNSKRGIELYLRHSPEQTGLPFWSFSGYGHMDRMPDFKIGQRLSKGEIVGPTGNSGLSARSNKRSRNRRPAIHLATFSGTTGKFSIHKGMVIPEGQRWLDPFAIYRGKAPFDSAAIKALPASEKSVMVPVLVKDGSTIPQATKTIWPYSCTRE